MFFSSEKLSSSKGTVDAYSAGPHGKGELDTGKVGGLLVNGDVQ